MKKFSILLFIVFSLNAQEFDKLYKEAEKLELQGKYKEANKIYKEIIKKEKTINSIYIDEDKKSEITAMKDTIDEVDDKETNETIAQIIASKFDIYPHHENYFFPISYDTNKRSDGRDSLETKFQLSIKKPIIHDFFGFDETINFGYTQTSWWQLYKDSSPFRETNYKPEIFVTIPYGKKDKTSLKAFTFGFLHESNGQAEPKSRSWNRIYLESYFQVGNLFAVPRVWYRIPEEEKDDDNPDIEDYMGYGDFTLIYPYKKHTFKALFRNNLKFDEDNKGFVQFDWTFPFFNSKNTFGYLQLSSGYGDSLIDYDKEINRINFGISLSR
ncbi:phospholipase [Malaciobacter pacificus]|uniref:Phosphatidylcholine 1-acylhydrolase n=1 Tax=Malaciobacter pacificus TaxID=1080223 RepID=A0A5C2H4Q9_9BACT|nr:phospholipase A [Malaciobacter pacificus]QEP33773.1 phospholipase A1 [Malaciobacter pacificus]GGD33200.1 phospholipase [Malaciobacter pacificus]